ncbi:MAG: pyrroline-5-carboxylate reductase family protein [Solirubrobacterales bacterium]
MIVGFVGSGNMAGAMARGWAGGGEGSPSQMLFTDAGSGRAAALADETGGEALGSNSELVARSDIVVLAVSPGHLDAVAGDLDSPGVLLSLLGATPLERLCGLFPGTDVLRLMPNLGVEVRKGVICVSEGGSDVKGLREQAFRALEVLGEVIELDEALMDPATAIMGCSPAFFADVAQALADVGTANGMEPEAALRMVALSMAGTADLLAQKTPFEISTEVAHPGGSTEAGLKALEAAGGPEAFRAAGDASLERMRER